MNTEQNEMKVEAFLESKVLQDPVSAVGELLPQ